jgi:hypothetical protein
MSVDDYDDVRMLLDGLEVSGIRELHQIVERKRADNVLLAKLVADYDRRMARRWGRFLMWLLRKTT